MFAAFGFVILLHIYRPCQPIDAFDVVFGAQMRLFHLLFDQGAGECDHADVVSRTGFYSHNVVFLQVEMIDVVIITFTRVLELHFDEVGRFVVSRHIGKVVVGVELLILPSYAAPAQSAVAA